MRTSVTHGNYSVLWQPALLLFFAEHTMATPPRTLPVVGAITLLVCHCWWMPPHGVPALTFQTNPILVVGGDGRCP